MSAGEAVVSRIINLKDLTYGGAKIELAAANTACYAIQLRSLSSKQLPLLYMLLGGGEQRIQVRGQGDRLVFRKPETGGITLQMAPRQTVAANITGPVAYVEVVTVHAPDVDLSILELDPWAVAPLFSRGLAVVAGAGQTPFVELKNNEQQDEVYGRCERIIIASTLAGTIDVRLGLHGNLSNSASAEPHNSQADAVVGRLTLFGAVTGPLGGNSAYLIPIAAPPDRIELTPAWELPRPAIGSGTTQSVVVNGPVGVGTLTVTYEWKELDVR